MSEEEKSVKKSKSTKVKKKANNLVVLEARRAVKEISNPDSSWDLTQEILQDIIAGFIVANPGATPKVPTLMEFLKKEIETRYEHDKEIKKILLDSIPSDKSVRAWFKKDGWEESVWSKIRNTGLFTHTKRSEVINALYERGLTKSDVAAKIYLTLSGDYSDKLEVNDNAVDKFREINKVLHSKNKHDDSN